jgi:hypothetical protein
MVKLLSIVLVLVVASATARAEEFSPFRRSLSDQPHGVTTVPGSRRGSVQRFEVRPGDCTSHDCYRDRERSELGEEDASSRVGDEYWYEFSFYLPKDFPNIYPAKTALGQFHQKGVTSPPVLFQYGIPQGSNTSSYYLDLNQTKIGHFPLISERSLRERWQNIRVHARWSMAADGLIRVYVNGRLAADVVGPNTTYANPIYFKYGVYRSFLSRYKSAYGSSEVPAQSALFRSVRKSKTMRGLLGTASGHRQLN